MSLEAQISTEDPAELKKIIASLTDDQHRYKERIKYLEEHIRLLKNEIFGRKTEKRFVPAHNQITLFDEAESDDSESAGQDDTEEKIRSRLQEFQKKTVPAIKYLKQRKIPMITVPGHLEKFTLENVRKSVLDEINKLYKNSE